MSEVILAAQDVAKTFRHPGQGTRSVVHAVRGVSFEVRRGETFGLVGESGSGKSTLGRCLLRLVSLSGGTVSFEGTNLTELSQRQLRPFRRRMQLVFQDPMSSLNPRLTVRSMLAEPLRVHGLARGQALEERIRELLSSVGLGDEALLRYPHEFSGGQRQRLVIARALCVEPSLLVADEPVSALDVSIRAQVINLLLDLKARLGLTYVFIAHDLALVGHVSDRVAVMYLGRIVELGPTTSVLATPRHPYTQSLLLASRGESREVPLGPEEEPKIGCSFAPRCPLAQPRCQHERPASREIDKGHSVACHFPS